MFHSINIGISTFISAGWKNDSLTILRKMNFLKGQLDRKKESLPPTEAYQKVPSTEVSGPQHSLRIYLQITY